MATRFNETATNADVTATFTCGKCKTLVEHTPIRMSTSLTYGYYTGECNGADINITAKCPHCGATNNVHYY